MTIALDQFLPYIIVIFAAIGAMIWGYRKGESEKKEGENKKFDAQPMQQWFFDGPLKVHFEIIKETNILIREQNDMMKEYFEVAKDNRRTLREILDVLAPRLRK